jgi:sterol desaturase/sphingolipid hydroxylase (fatty acid hydroxylase superfamily)
MDWLGLIAEWLNFKVVLITCLIFVPLERMLAMHSGQRLFRQGWKRDLVYVFINGWITKLGIGFGIAGTLVISAWLVPSAIHATVASQPYWLQVVEIILIADLGFYFAHRMFHAVPALWKFHQIHHSIEELDWLAAARVHPIDQIVTKWISLTPVFALGFSEAAIVTFGLLYYWQSILIHANVRIGFGPLNSLIASPEFHHWHHSRNLEARDKNFAGQLSIIDILFGTAHMPRKAPDQYGIDEPVPPTYAAQLLHPFNELRRERATSARQSNDSLI